MTLHYKAEGRQSYAVLLFAPSSRPFDLFEPERKGRVKLYVRRVYITRRCRPAAALPALRARRHRQRGPAAQHLARDAAEQPAGGADPQGRHGPRARRARDARGQGRGRLRQGLGGLRQRAQGRHLRGPRAARPAAGAGALHDDQGRAGCARSRTTWPICKPNQTAIYYLVGDSIERLKSSPKLEAARARGVEVLLLTDPVDAFWTAHAARLRGQAAEVAEPGRRRFRPGAPARARRRSRRCQAGRRSTMP